jgi:antitoxin PrlF
MTTATLTSKGQLTLPKAIRDRLHLRAGDRLEVTLREDGVILMEPVMVDVSQLKGILPAPASPVSLEAMEEAIRQRAGR